MSLDGIPVGPETGEGHGHRGEALAGLQGGRHLFARSGGVDGEDGEDIGRGGAR